MGDHRADIKIHMNLHGKNYDTSMWINYSPNNDGIDDRIVEWFAECWHDAHARYEAEVYEREHETRERETAQRERAELARLRAKYPDEVT